MKDEFDKIDAKLDKINDELAVMNATLIKQEENLKLHIYRTELAEKRLEHIENDMLPIKTHVIMIKGIGAFVVGFSVVVGILVALKELFS